MRLIATETQRKPKNYPTAMSKSMLGNPAEVFTILLLRASVSQW
jgi:hypothetical protein